MIRTKIVEMSATATGIAETELGYCLMGEVPVEKRGVQPKQGDDLPPPTVVKINGANFFVIGHTWDIVTEASSEPETEATLVLIVQRVPAAPKIIPVDERTRAVVESLRGSIGNGEVN